jgi:hypothetical protein
MQQQQQQQQQQRVLAADTTGSSSTSSSNGVLQCVTQAAEGAHARCSMHASLGPGAAAQALPRAPACRPSACVGSAGCHQRRLLLRQLALPAHEVSLRLGELALRTCVCAAAAAAAVPMARVLVRVRARVRVLQR